MKAAERLRQARHELLGIVSSDGDTYTYTIPPDYQGRADALAAELDRLAIMFDEDQTSEHLERLANRADSICRTIRSLANYSSGLRHDTPITTPNLEILAFAAHGLKIEAGRLAELARGLRSLARRRGGESAPPITDDP